MANYFKQGKKMSNYSQAGKDIEDMGRQRNICVGCHNLTNTETPLRNIQNDLFSTCQD